MANFILYVVLTSVAAVGIFFNIRVAVQLLTKLIRIIRRSSLVWNASREWHMLSMTIAFQAVIFCLLTISLGLIVDFNIVPLATFYMFCLQFVYTTEHIFFGLEILIRILLNLNPSKVLTAVLVCLPWLIACTVALPFYEPLFSVSVYDFHFLEMFQSERRDWKIVCELLPLEIVLVLSIILLFIVKKQYNSISHNECKPREVYYREFNDHPVQSLTQPAESHVNTTEDFSYPQKKRLKKYSSRASNVSSELEALIRPDRKIISGVRRLRKRRAVTLSEALMLFTIVMVMAVINLPSYILMILPKWQIHEDPYASFFLILVFMERFLLVFLLPSSMWLTFLTKIEDIKQQHSQVKDTCTEDQETEPVYSEFEQDLVQLKWRKLVQADFLWQFVKNAARLVQMSVHRFWFKSDANFSSDQNSDIIHI